MPEQYRRFALPVGVMAIAVAAATFLWQPAVAPTEGAPVLVKTEATAEVRRVEPYAGKLPAVLAAVGEQSQSRQVVRAVASRQQAEQAGLLNMVELEQGGSRKRYLFFPGHVNYVDPRTGEVREADPTFAAQPDGTFAVTKASYGAVAPAFADEPLRFTVDGEVVTFTPLGVGTDTLQAVGHVAGVLEGTRVRYPDALGAGVDYVIQAEADEVRKLVVFKTAPAFAEDFRVEFATSLQVESVIRGRNTQLGLTHFRQPSVWDSGSLAQPITVNLTAGRLAKVLPISFFTGAERPADAPPVQYPVTTDVTTSYYAGAGDGYVYYSFANQSNWATAHHDTGTNATADYTGSTARISSQSDSGGYKPMRAFLPIDTSGIADNDEITAARLKIYATAKTNNDDDGNDYINVVQTTQASTSSLVAADYDTCGDVHSPSTGATSLDLGSITAGMYLTLTLNSTGEGWISKTSTTQLGLREGHDIADDIPNATNDVTFSTSEATGTSQDPYLDVDTTAAAINSVTRVNADTGKEIFATSTEGIDITANFTGETNGNTTIEYVFFMDLDADNEPDTNETYITNNCAGNAAWSSGAYTHQTSAFTISDGASPKSDSWSCLDSSFGSEVGVYKIYVKWYDANGTIVATGTPSFQYCDQPTGITGWWDTGYENRALIQFRSATFNEALINFPVLVKATTTNQILDDIETSGDDVRFTDEDTGTLLDYEREFVDATTTREAYYWVEVPKVATSTDCDYIFMYYDGGGATTTYSTSTATWRQDYYEAVWHFGENNTSTSYNFQEGVSPDSSYTGADGVMIGDGSPTTNLINKTVFQVDYDTTVCGGSAKICRMLMQWDISSISSCTVGSASITVNITGTGATDDRFGVYGLRRNWGETTATWNTYDGSNSWTTAGAGDATNDYYNTDLMNGNADGGWGSATGSGSETFNFDSDGVSLIQDWINGVTTNNGIIIRDHDSTDNDGSIWSTTTDATLGSRPKLTINCGSDDLYLDSTVNNHDETNSTVASRKEKGQSKFGYSPKLAGSAGTGIGIPDSAGFDVTSYTITGWFRRDGTGDPATFSASQTMEPFIGKGYAEADTQAADIQFSVGYNRSGQATLGANWEDDRHASGNDWSHLGGTTIANSVWRHFGVRLKDKAILNLYLDGFANNTTTYPVNQGASTGGTMKLGIGTVYNTSGTADSGWNGYLDELRVYKVAVATSTLSGESVWMRAEWYTADNGYVEWLSEATTTMNLTQVHYRWRNDDANEASATWGGAEDTATSSINIGEVKRLRFEVSNEGTTSSSQMFLLQYGTGSSPKYGDWYTVPVTGNCDYSVFCMNASSLTEGSATTNVASGLTDENTTFVAGLQKESNATTTHISLGNTNFTEFEFAFLVATSSVDGMTYYFRLATTTGNGVAGQLNTYSEVPALTVSGAKPIYRSVGIFTSDLQKGSATTTLSIWDGLAVFSSSLPDNIGVGDAIQYDADNNASIDTIAFIRSRLSGTQYLLQTALGAMATSTFATTTVVADNDWAAYRAYISLSNAETGTENTGINSTVRNFDTWSGGKTIVATSSNEIWNIAAYADGADTTNFALNGWVLATSTYLRIYTPTSTAEVGTSQRHNGTWGNGYRLSNATLTISNNFVRIDGISLKRTNDANLYTFAPVEDGEMYISNNYGEFTLNVIRHVYAFSSSKNTNFYAWNNIGINNSTVRDTYAFNRNQATTNVYLYNNTGIASAGSAFFTNYIGYKQLVNNIGYSATGTAFLSDDLTVGKKWNDVKNNSSNDASADDFGGTGNLINQTFTFVDSANSDYHIAAGDAGAQALGLDVSASSTLAFHFTDDIDGATRTGTWDIGADEITGATLSITASTTVLAFPAVTYNFSAQTTTTANPTAGSVQVGGGGGTWTLNLNCNANGQQCYWNGPTERDRFRLRGGVNPSDVPSTTGILCITDPFTCNVQGGGACTGVTLTAVGCIGTASTKTMATGSSATATYWLKEADWDQGIPGGTSAGIYTTTITWDLQ